MKFFCESKRKIISKMRVGLIFDNIFTSGNNSYFSTDIFFIKKLIVQTLDLDILLED